MNLKSNRIDKIRESQLQPTEYFLLWVVAEMGSVASPYFQIFGGNIHSPVEASLVEKGWLEESEAGTYQASKKWFDLHGQSMDFDELWNIYGKGHKKDAEYEYRKIIAEGVAHETIVRKAREFIHDHLVSNNQSLQYVPHLRNWLEGRRFEEANLAQAQNFGKHKLRRL